MRHNLSDEFLRVIFKYSNRQAVSLAISLVRKSLMLQFVPNNIGLYSITREDYNKNHVTPFFNVLYNPNLNESKAILIVDASYSYMEKSSNFKTLRQSFSVHKGRHLVKPVLVVAPNGFILDIHGPYFYNSRNNDAAIFKNEFERDAAGLRVWLRRGDIIIADRGYRDVVPFLEEEGICKILPVLQRGESQHSTEAANKSRLITKSRWVVESRNGHIKTIFLDGIIPMAHILNQRDFYL